MAWQWPGGCWLQEVNDEDITPHCRTGYNAQPRDTWEIYWLGTESQLFPSCGVWSVPPLSASVPPSPSQRGQDAGAEE